MMPLNHTLRKYTAGYKLSKVQEKFKHLMYMDDIKLFAKNDVVNLKGRICINEVYQQGSMSYIP